MKIMINPERVISYIDGYNLYFGLRAAFDRRYLWLNLQKLSHALLKPYQQLAFTKYFTTMVAYPPEKVKRQTNYIDALKTLKDFEIYQGHFQQNLDKCRKCGYKTITHCEKMTDVNIAVELLKDAFLDRFDTALLTTADSDLVPLIQSVKTLFPNKKIIVAFPPKRSSKQLQNVAFGFTYISRIRIEKSLFPNTITTKDGYILKRPSLWY